MANGVKKQFLFKNNECFLVVCLPAFNTAMIFPEGGLLVFSKGTGGIFNIKDNF